MTDNELRERLDRLEWMVEQLCARAGIHRSLIDEELEYQRQHKAYETSRKALIAQQRRAEHS